MHLVKMRWAAAHAWLLLFGGACSAGGTARPMGSGAAGGGGAGGTMSYTTGGAGTATATGGTTGQGTGGAAAARDPSLFSWPEATPDGSAALLCKAGHYVGTYSCDVTGNGLGGDGGTPYHLTGPVDLRLEQSQSGEFMSVSGGTLKSAAGLLALDATLVGTLDCQTGAFTGTLQNGTLSFLLLPAGTFAGDLSALFVSSGPTLDGSWTLRGTDPNTAAYSCTGPWNATWQAQ